MKHGVLRLGEHSNQEELSKFLNALDVGYTLNPKLGVVQVGDIALYHLVKYDSEEERIIVENGVHVNSLADVVSIKSVSYDEADELLKNGYELTDKYAKTVTLVLRRR